MPQSSYLEKFNVGIAGTVAKGLEDEGVTKSAYEALDFGKFVAIQDTAGLYCKLPATATAKIDGIAKFKHKAPVAGLCRYEANEPVSIAKEGCYYAIAAEAITDVKNPVYVDITSSDKGKVRQSANKVTTVTLTFSGNLVSSNVVNGVVNGFALSATTFATDHATTMGAIATKIAAVSGVDSATVSGNTIVVVSDADVDLELHGFIVTAGASQATVTYPTTSTQDGILLENAVFEKKQDTVDGVVAVNINLA